MHGCKQAGLSSTPLRPQRELPPPAPPAGITRSKSKHELKLLEKIPENAEATVVLVGMSGCVAHLGGGRPGGQPASLSAAPGWGLGGGLCPDLAHDGPTPPGCVEFLSRPTMAFVRLREAVELDAVLEVPVPVRFLFLLLGPSSANMDYHEIGRSISTLMSDKVSPGAEPSPAPGPWPLACALTGPTSASAAIPRGGLPGRRAGGPADRHQCLPGLQCGAAALRGAGRGATTLRRSLPAPDAQEAGGTGPAAAPGVGAGAQVGPR